MSKLYLVFSLQWKLAKMKKHFLGYNIQNNDGKCTFIDFSNFESLKLPTFIEIISFHYKMSSVGAYINVKSLLIIFLSSINVVFLSKTWENFRNILIHTCKNWWISEIVDFLVSCFAL